MGTYFSRGVCCIEFQQRTERRKPTTRHRRNSPVSFEALLKKRRARYDDFHADAMRRNRYHRTRHRDTKGAGGTERAPVVVLKGVDLPPRSRARREEKSRRPLKTSPTLVETCSRTHLASPPRLPLWAPLAEQTQRTTKASRRRECPTLDFWNTWTWAESRRLICTPTVRSRSWKRFRRNWATECKESECDCQAPPASFCKNSEKRMSTLRRTASPKIPVASS